MTAQQPPEDPKLPVPPGRIQWWELEPSGYGEPEPSVPEPGEHDVIAARPCYMCGSPLVLIDRADPGHAYPYKCPDCGGQSRGWFAADGTEYDDGNDDPCGRPPWDQDYEGPVPPRDQWSADWSRAVPLPPLCPGCEPRVMTLPGPGGWGVAVIFRHEPRCLQLAALSGS